MNNHPYKLLAVDIDGTLLNKSGLMSPEDKRALVRVRTQGMAVSISTGRGIIASMRIIDELALDSYHIFFDGALVSNPHDGQEVYAQPLDKATVEAMVEYAHRHKVDLELFSVTKYFAERETWSTKAHRDFFGVPATITGFDGIWERERIIKGGLVAATPAEVDKAKDFRQRFEGALFFSTARTPAYPGVDFINIITPGVSKGKALEALASHLGIRMNEVMAIGDGVNDIPFLASAGLAVAMGNALEEVKQIAHHITLDVEHSGVAAALERFLL